MALAQVRKAGRPGRALGQHHIRLFHCSATLQEKWRCKYKNRTGYDTDNSHKKYVAYERRLERAANRKDLLNWRLNVSFSELEGSHTSTKSKSQDSRWSRKKVTSKKTNDWEAYLKYEGDWERFCRKFTNLSDFESRRSPRERNKRMWQEWDTEEEDEDEDDDDGWDDDPTFGSRYRKPRAHTQQQTFKARTVVTIGQRSDRLALGLPPAGSLTMDQLKAAFRAAALKWHPDRHHGSTKETAEEKFKLCGNAYRALCGALAESNRA